MSRKAERNPDPFKGNRHKKFKNGDKSKMTLYSRNNYEIPTVC